MNHLAIITSLFVSLITCSFIVGILTLCYAPILYIYPLTFAYSFTEFIEALFTSYLTQLFLVLYLPSVAITYYMITE